MSTLLRARSTDPHVRRSSPRQGSVRGIVALVAVLLVACLLSLAVGSRAVSPVRVVEVLLHPDRSAASGIVHGLRIPRTLLGVLAGVCLGVAGALMQGHTRNPLAEPGLLGVSAGAAFAVVAAVFGLGIRSVSGYTWFALLGAGIAAAAVFAIGSTRGGPSPVTLVLAGTAVTALLQAMTNALVLRDATTLDAYRFWVVGSVAGRGTDVLVQALPFALAGLALAAFCTAGLDLLQLGDDAATALGLHPRRHKVMGLTAVMLLTGAATAACGPIAFLGLVVPHVARFLAGVGYTWVLPYSALLGAVVLVLADVAGRVIALPGEVQVGIVMALVGGPVFIALVRRHRAVRL